jgi:hypothetical protein
MLFGNSKYIRNFKDSLHNLNKYTMLKKTYLNDTMLSNLTKEVLNYGKKTTN